jgi:hypothetical protein
VALALQLLDDLEGPQAQRLPGRAVVLAVPLTIAGHAPHADVGGIDRELGHPAVGHVDAMDDAGHPHSVEGRREGGGLG